MPSNACGLIAPHPHSTPECRSHSSALHTKACIAKQILHLRRADQIEIPWDRVLEDSGCQAEVE